MSEFTFTAATKRQRKARIFLTGPSGSGKTWTALTWAKVLGERIAVLDTEGDSALDYADEFTFDHLTLRPPYTPARYIAALNAAIETGHDVLVVDSLSHAWFGRGGILEQKDEFARTHRGDSFNAWRDLTPQHNSLFEALVAAPLHIIGTARAKSDYVMEQDDRGKWKPVKLGLAPVQRDGVEFEFAVVAEMSVPDNILTITKSRCAALQGLVVEKPDAKVAETLRDWLGQGEEVNEEDRPTVAALFAAAKATDDYAELLALYKQAEKWHLSPSEVHDHDTGWDLTLGEFIAARGRKAKERGGTDAA